MMLAVNLAGFYWMQNLAGLLEAVETFGNATLDEKSSEIKRADRQLFRLIVDLVGQLGEIDFEQVPSGLVKPNLVAFVDHLICRSIYDDESYDVEGLARALGKMRRAVPLTQSHNLVCDFPIRARHPHLVEAIGLEPLNINMRSFADRE